MVYYFFDTDSTGNEEYDIKGEEFSLLLNTCLKYSTVLSLYYEGHVTPIKELEPYRISVNQELFKKHKRYGHYRLPEDAIIYYRVCEDVIEIMKKRCSNIFGWLYGWGYVNPMDPIFYRSDGSVFFTSLVHEGVIALNPKEDEDVSELTSNPLWIAEDTMPHPPFYQPSF